jgi:hypothetical protein
MRAVVVYESLWGNTEKVARAVGDELGRTMSVRVFDVESAPPTVDDYDLVVVGGPTHGFSMTRPSTREGAVTQNGAPRAPAVGIREWLEQLPHISVPVKAVAFDTRVDKPRLPGSAAKAARHELRSLGFDVSMKAKSFRVHGYEGPLVDGELGRAVEWARQVEAAVQTAQTAPSDD